MTNTNTRINMLTKVSFFIMHPRLSSLPKTKKNTKKIVKKKYKLKISVTAEHSKKLAHSLSYMILSHCIFGCD